MTTMPLRLAECRVTVSPGRVETVLPGGLLVLGLPHDTPDYHRIARQLGYESDVARLNRDHELVHTLLAHWLGLPCSPTFRRVAGGDNDPSDLTRIEEAAVLATQSFATMMGVDLLEVAKRWSAAQ